MKRMEPYCKAYPLDRFAQFPGWSEVMLDEHDREIGYLFLQSNMIVTRDIFANEGIVFDKVTDEWRKFCAEVLDFRLPDYLSTIEESTEAQA